MRDLLKRVIAECGGSDSSAHISTKLYCDILEKLEKPEPYPVFLSDDEIIDLIPSWGCEIDWHVDATIALAELIQQAALKANRVIK